MKKTNSINLCCKKQDFSIMALILIMLLLAVFSAGQAEDSSIKVISEANAPAASISVSEDSSAESGTKEGTNRIFYAHINGKVLKILAADNSSADAFLELLKTGSITIDMHDYGSFEKVGPLGTTLPRNDEQITTEPGDVILYQGNQITIYYDVNNWSFTRLGKVQGLSQSELKEILGDENAVVTFSLSDGKSKSENSSILVVIFSRTGHTKPLAEYIAEELKADLYEIEAKIPYTDEDIKYNTDCRADQEQKDPYARPEIAGNLPDITGYDIIFLGYPIWHGQAPKIIYTFLESKIFTGKTIIPFCTSHSSPLGSSAENLHPLASDSDWKEGRRFAIGTTQDEISEWIKSLNIQTGQTEGEGNTGNTPSASHNLVLIAEKAATCTEAGNSAYWKCEVCGKYFSDSTGATEIDENSWIIEATGHSWGEPAYEWINDNTQIAATRICEHDKTHTETETVHTFRKLTVPPTEKKTGVYQIVSKEFENDAFSIQKKENLVISALEDLDVLYLPAAMKTIETGAFDGISAEAVIIMDECTLIEQNAFVNCKNLFYFSIPADLEITDNTIFDNPTMIIDLR